MTDNQKFLDNKIGLPALWASIKSLFISIKDIATIDKVGIVKPDGKTITIDETGLISSIGGSGGGSGGVSGPIWLEYDEESGNLYAYYDDLSSPPALEYDEESGNLYALFETE